MNGYFVTFYHSPTCGYCKLMQEAVNDLSQKYLMPVSRINVAETGWPDIASQEGIPCLAISPFDGSRPKKVISGLHSPAELDAFFELAKAYADGSAVATQSQRCCS